MTKLIRILGIGVILFTGGCSESGPETVADQYWQAVLTGNTEQVAELIGVPSDLELSRMIQPGSGSRVLFGEPQVNGDNASVHTMMHWVDDGKDAEFELQTALVQIDGQWKIDAEKTQYSFFNSVYQSGLEPSEPGGADSRPDADSAELKVMMEELNSVNQELQQQTSDDNQVVLEFLRKLGEQAPEDKQ